MIILLTGEKGSGKSTVAMGLAKRLIQSGIPVGGVICPGIFELGRKTGIKTHYPENGHEEIAGSEIPGRNGSLTGQPVPMITGPDTFSYGRWEFRLSILTAADAVIIRDTEAARFVFVDEIGPLELDHGMGMAKTLARLDADKKINNCSILVCARQDLAQTLVERWPESRLVKLAEEGQKDNTSALEYILETATRWHQSRN